MESRLSHYLISATSFKLSYVYWFFGALTVSFIYAVPNVVDGPVPIWSLAMLRFFTVDLGVIAAGLGAALVLLELGLTAAFQALVAQPSKVVKFIEFWILGAFNLIVASHLVSTAYALTSQSS